MQRVVENEQRMAGLHKKVLRVEEVTWTLLAPGTDASDMIKGTGSPRCSGKQAIADSIRHMQRRQVVGMVSLTMTATIDSCRCYMFIWPDCFYNVFRLELRWRLILLVSWPLEIVLGRKFDLSKMIEYINECHAMLRRMIHASFLFALKANVFSQGTFFYCAFILCVNPKRRTLNVGQSTRKR